MSTLDGPAGSRSGPRPPVSLIVPFAGSDQQLRTLHTRLEQLNLGPGDTLVVSDNRRHPVRTPAYARNQGAADARGEWLLFLDADAHPRPDLIDAYFDPPPQAATGILAGAVQDIAATTSLVARHAVARAQMSHQTTLQRPGRPYAQTVNCAIRRAAFTDAGGFAERARAGEDADLCFRLQEAGWGIEARANALVRHEARAGLIAWLAQLAVHGSGAAWVDRRWPGEFPAPSPRQLAARLAREVQAAVRAAVHGETRDAAFALLDAAGACAFEFGRALPNDRWSRGEAHLRGFRR